MMEFFNVLLIALFIEAIVNTLKPIWTKGEKKMSVSEYVAMGIGILLAVSCKIDMLGYIVELTWPMPGWVQYIFYVLTGIAIGRGTNFLYDLWNKLKEWKNGNVLEGVMEGIAQVGEAKNVDIEITNWSMEQLRGFCELNGIPAAWCVDREDYIEAITTCFTREEKEPPENGDAE